MHCKFCSPDIDGNVYYLLAFSSVESQRIDETPTTQ